MSTRWMVERTRDDFEDVGAECMEVLPSGALEFYNLGALPGERTDRILLAPGQWISVCEESE